MAGIYTTGKSHTHQVMDGQTVQTDEVSTDHIITQRISDESGAFQVEFSTDPGGGATGECVLEGRLSPDAPWATLASFDIVDLNGLSPISKIMTGVTITPETRFAFRNSVSVSGTPTANVWIME